MRKRGKRPRRTEPVAWTAEFAYALGLLATDGCLSNDGRHLELTSKDREQLENFRKCLGLKVKIGQKTSSYTGKKITRIQFGDVVLYRFLLGLGFTPAKTKTIGKLDIPHEYIFDFLRGHLDGDGCFYSYWDPRWKSSFMYYVNFTSSSEKHITWIQTTLSKMLSIKGHISKAEKGSIINLRYAKRESLKLLRKIYYSPDVVCLSRKRLKIEKALGIMGQSL